jgi:hypothetical protein
MARGVLPNSETNSSAFKIGLGYEYNVWKTAGLDCACACFADPVCDGRRTDAADVVATIGVALRGLSSVEDPSCPIVGSDVDCSGAVDIMDVVKMIDVAFRGGNLATTFCSPCP